MTLYAYRSSRLPSGCFVLALAVLTGFASSTAIAQQTDPIIAKVNGVAIRQSTLALADADIGKNFPTEDPDKKRDFLINYLTDMILITGAVKGTNAADDPSIQRRVAFVKDKLLMDRVIDNVNKTAVTEAAVRDAYEETAHLLEAEDEFHVKTILLRNPENADDQAKAEVLAKILTAAERVRKGEEFSAVAQELSQDPIGHARGGDLGFLNKQQMSPKFFDAVSKLADGQISEPFETEAGWAIATVVEKRKRHVPPLEQVKDQVENYVRGKAQFALVEKLRAQAKIERLDKPEEAKP